MPKRKKIEELEIAVLLSLYSKVKRSEKILIGVDVDTLMLNIERTLGANELVVSNF
jgi:hypothetical protein